MLTCIFQDGVHHNIERQTRDCFPISAVRCFLRFLIVTESLCIRAEILVTVRRSRVIFLCDYYDICVLCASSNIMFQKFTALNSKYYHTMLTMFVPKFHSLALPTFYYVKGRNKFTARIKCGCVNLTDSRRSIKLTSRQAKFFSFIFLR